MTGLDGAWLDARLEAVGSNRAGLSRALGRDRSVVTKLVQGKRQLRLREVDIVATHLRCSRNEVLGWAGRTDLTAAPEGFGEMEQSTIEPHKAQPSKQPQPPAKGRHPAFGVWKGKVTLLPDYDYTQPADPEWGKVYED